MLLLVTKIDGSISHSQLVTTKHVCIGINNLERLGMLYYGSQRAAVYILVYVPAQIPSGIHVRTIYLAHTIPGHSLAFNTQHAGQDTHRPKASSLVWDACTGTHHILGYAVADESDEYVEACLAWLSLTASWLSAKDVRKELRWVVRVSPSDASIMTEVCDTIHSPIYALVRGRCRHLYSRLAHLQASLEMQHAACSM